MEFPSSFSPRQSWTSSQQVNNQQQPPPPEPYYLSSDIPQRSETNERYRSEDFNPACDLSSDPGTRAPCDNPTPVYNQSSGQWMTPAGQCFALSRTDITSQQYSSPSSQSPAGSDHGCNPPHCTLGNHFPIPSPLLNHPQYSATSNEPSPSGGPIDACDLGLSQGMVPTAVTTANGVCQDQSSDYFAPVCGLELMPTGAECDGQHTIPNHNAVSTSCNGLGCSEGCNTLPSTCLASLRCSSPVSECSSHSLNPQGTHVHPLSNSNHSASISNLSGSSHSHSLHGTPGHPSTHGSACSPSPVVVRSLVPIIVSNQPGASESNPPVYPYSSRGNISAIGPRDSFLMNAQANELPSPQSSLVDPMNMTKPQGPHSIQSNVPQCSATSNEWSSSGGLNGASSSQGMVPTAVTVTNNMSTPGLPNGYSTFVLGSVPTDAGQHTVLTPNLESTSGMSRPSHNPHGFTGSHLSTSTHGSASSLSPVVVSDQPGTQGNNILPFSCRSPDNGSAASPPNVCFNGLEGCLSVQTNEVPSYQSFQANPTSMTTSATIIDTQRKEQKALNSCRTREKKAGTRRRRYRWLHEYLVYEYINRRISVNQIEILWKENNAFGEAYKLTSGRRKFIRVGWYMSEEERRVFEGMEENKKHDFCAKRYRLDQRKLTPKTTSGRGVQTFTYTLWW